MPFYDTEFPGGAIALGLHHFVRFAQFVIGITVLALYATDLSAARHSTQYASSNWVYGIIVGVLSAILALLYFIPFMTRGFLRFLWSMDFVMWVMYLALFIDFGSKYIHYHTPSGGNTGGPSVRGMKNAVWVDLVGLILWLVSMVWGAASFCAGRRQKTMYTGRAVM